MPKKSVDVDPDKPLEQLLLECQREKYKLAYAALRWAKEIKQKENLPESIPMLVPRSLREILTGEVAIAQVEKLPVGIKIAPQPQPKETTPTITLKGEEK